MNFIRKNIEHLTNFLKYLWERLICIILLLIFIAIITFLFFHNCVILNPGTVSSQEILFFGISLTNIGTWFTSIALFFTAIWSMYQYTKSRLSKQQEKAAKIAQDFSDNLVERMGLISTVLMSNEASRKIIENLDTERLSQFTHIELLKIINNEEVFDTFQNIIEDEKTQKLYDTLLKSTYNEFEYNKFDSSFALLIENTLNRLEALCINISSKAAGSQFIYDSLHFIFLSTIEILSIKIATDNVDNVDKYYINIISVYNMWKGQKNIDIKKYNKYKNKIKKLAMQADKKVTNLMKKSAKEQEKLQDKQTKTV